MNRKARRELPRALRPKGPRKHNGRRYDRPHALSVLANMLPKGHPGVFRRSSRR